jgi:Di-haem cytochrome c peroxidase
LPEVCSDEKQREILLIRFVACPIRTDCCELRIAGERAGACWGPGLAGGQDDSDQGSAWPASGAIPADNPLTEDTIALGRRLYYDPQLSANGTISCASCHAPEFAFSDEHRVSIGVGKKTGTRHSPAVINSAYNSLQF